MQCEAKKLWNHKKENALGARDNIESGWASEKKSEANGVETTLKNVKFQKCPVE